MADGSDFYTTSAAILPVFYLTLAVEQRANGFFSDEVAQAFAAPDNRALLIFRSAYSLLVTLVLAIGEAAAIVGIVTDAPLRFSDLYLGEFVLAGLVVGGFGVVAPTVVVHANALFQLVLGVDPHLTLLRILAILGGLAFFVYMTAVLVSALLH